MKICVKRTGGFAGLTTQWAVEVGGDELEKDWLDAIEACPWESIPDQQNQPDRYMYDIRAGEHRVTLPEGQVTGPWLSLVDMTRRAAGQQPE
ncbi:protealysin inhibitor emfourin [Arthrobacter sp. GCM10027362]|uniref:protealysin inhibitor emfourin n=1 Tax=Arthrobacter sp. GCM10027362 TaxID=3273379 RepID=UPI0036379724